MGELMRKFNILLWKNYQVRKKHWGISIFGQLVIPVLLCALMIFGNLDSIIGKNRDFMKIRNGTAPDGVESNPIELQGFPNIIGYTPQSNDTNQLMELFKNCLNAIIFSYENETQMLDAMLKSRWTTPRLGIVFKVDSKGNLFENGLEYKLRTQINDKITKIQYCVDISYIKKITDVDINIKSLKLKYTQIDKRIVKPFNEMLDFCCLIIFLVFIITYSIEMVYIAKEKTVGINALMSLNGVENWMNLLSWLVTGVIWNSLLILPIVLMLKIFLVPEASAFMPNGNPLLIFMALTVYIAHLLCFGYHVASYFHKPWKGVVTSISFLCIMSTGQSILQVLGYNQVVKYVSMISPSFFLDKVLYEVEIHERHGMGIGFGNMFSTVKNTESFLTSIGMIMIYILLGAMLHFYMALYIHAIRPGKYGVKRHPFAWFLKKNKTEDDQRQLDSDELEHIKEFEKIPAGSLRAGVQMRKLKKIYNTGFINKNKFHALKDVSADFYHGEITALLGHNGAGKTTMMSILSGLTDSSGGDVIINGKNILNDHGVISDNVGLCPQVNVTVPDLNVYQQILFFAKLRGKNKTSAQIKEDCETLLSKVNLQDKKNCIPDKLSVGQKRRLCLAIAVIGDANVLIFDEPTSGMDAEGKRQVWDIILGMRGNKTILISTHDMEEADILGDRIAIMHSGKLNSYGTPMFLKKLHGDGQVEVTLSLESDCDTSKIFEVIGGDVKTVDNSNDSIVLAVPNSESLPELLDQLETEKQNLGITGISASIITLEQVFVKVTKEIDINTNGTMNKIDNDTTLFDKNTGLNYFMQSLWGYLMKKCAYAMKSPWSFLLRLILPCLIISLILTFLFFSITIISKLDFGSIDLTFNDDSVSLYNEWKTSKQNSADKINTDFISGNELFLTAQYGNILNTTFSVKKLFNSFIRHNNGIYESKIVNFIDNALLKIYSNNSNSKIQVSTQFVVDDNILILIYNFIKEKSLGVATVITMSMIIILIPFYISHPLSERKSGIKQLQDMTGASKTAYWGSMLLVDFGHYTMTVVLSLATLLFFDNLYDTQIFKASNITMYLLIMLSFGLAGLFKIYVFSFINLSEIVLKIILIVVPLLIVLVCFIFFGLCMKSIKTSDSSDDFIKFSMKMLKILIFVPQLNLLYASAIYYCDTFAYDKKNDIIMSKYNMPTLLYCLIIFVILFILFIGIIIIVEQKLISKVYRIIKKDNTTSTNIIETDELVQKERAIVNKEVKKRLTKTVEQNNENIFLAHELKKNYGNLQVVKDISFRIKSGECFGFLGVNGAGKSTTFKMLTGQENPAHGIMYLEEINMHDNPDKYLSKMGYCPQHDALIETLNAWDHLYLFARLRGIPESQIKSSVEGWIKRLNLSACASRPSKTYSGGNKRRLNIALALIGKPSLVLMDEPTTGVDPAARRSLWRTLKYCQNSGQSIILTSHSMEECEALCNRLVIMVNGKLVCVGAVQELKQRFGAGYNIHIKMSPISSAEDVQHIKETIESSIKCQLMDENVGFLGYHVTDPAATWTVMYQLMNTLKSDYNCIDDFAVLSSTLEQLFIQFARAENTVVATNDIP